MKSLLASKDLMNSQLQIQLGKLNRENERLALLAGVKRKISFQSAKSFEDHQNNSKIIVKPRNELSSDSGCDNLTSDNASLSDENTKVNPDNQLNLSALPPVACPIPPVQAPLSESLIQDISCIKGPKLPIASRAVNAKLHLVDQNKLDYVLVTRNISDAATTTGLYVLDTVQARGDTAEPGAGTNDDTSDKAGTNDKVSNTGTVAANKTTVTPVHAMTNHRAMIKPSDIKYRAKMKAVTMSEKTTLSYLTDTFL